MPQTTPPPPPPPPPLSPRYETALVMISAALKFWCLYCCFTCQPHSHPGHPDYIPSVFPAENKLLSHKRSEQDMSRLHHFMERSAKQAKRQMKETEDREREVKHKKKDFRRKRSHKEVPT